MKILIIHNHYLEKGGEDEVVNSEVRLLKEHGHKVIFYEKTNEYIEPLPFFKKSAFTLFELRFSRNVYKELNEIINTEKPDVAHIHNIFFCITPAVYFVLKENRVPIVQSLHNYRLFCLRGTFYNRGAVCEKCIDKRLFEGILGKCWINSFFPSFFLAQLLDKKDYFLKNIDSYIVTSQFSKNKFIELGLDASRLHLKTNFLTVESEGSIQDKNYALFLGRLVDYKGVETLMKAFEITPSLNLRIIGDGPLKDKVQKFATTHKNVEYLSRIDRDSVIREIKNSSFLIFPSECYENMPLVIIESFAFSKPVLASNLGAIKEFVIDGVSGVLFEPGNATDLSNKASYLFSLNKERLVMGKKANDIYLERFNKEKNYRDLIGIYSKTINASKTGLDSLIFTYSLADQNFNQTKSVGVFNVSTQLFENLASRVHFKKLNLLSNSTLGNYLKLPQKVTILHNNRAGNRLGRLLWDQWGVYAAVKDTGSQWLFLPKGFTSLFRPRGFKLAVYIHDAMHDYYKNNYPGIMPWFESMYFTQCLKGTFKYASIIFTNSYFSKGELERLGADLKLELPQIIVAGIGFTRAADTFPKKRNSLLLLTSAWPHKLTERAVGYIRRWQQDTGFSGDVELVGSLPPGLILPRFLNWRHHQRLSETEYRQFLAEAKILAFFSRYEGFGMPPVEAMIAGACPVFSDLPVTREVMREIGFSFSNDSYESFSQAMNNALGVSETQIQLWAEQLLEHHSWDKVVEKITSGLTQVAE